MKSIKSFSVFLFFGILLTPVAYAFPGWNNINTIYYNAAEDDATNRFLQQAANELQTNLGQVDKTMTISTTQPAVGIFLKVDPNLPELVNRNDEAFNIFSDSNGITITGKTPIAVRHGAYTLLEKLGFRYFFKHPIWKVKPTSLVSLDGLNEVQEPDFIYRLIWVGPPSNYLYPDWMKWNRMGGAKGVSVYNSYFAIIPSSEFSTNPSLFCTDKNGVPRQLNLDNPEVLTRAINYARNYFLNNPTSSNYNIGDTVTTASVSISPNDGWGWDSCYGTNVTVITDKVFNFSNEVAKTLKTEFPERYIATLDYSLYSGVPSFNLESSVLAVVTTYYSYSGLSVAQRLQGLAQRGATIGIYDYYDIPPWYYDMPGTEFYQRVSNIPLIASYNAKVFIAESANGWGARGPLFYTASKLLWGANANPDSILDDFYTKAFGPAKDSIKRYYDRWYNGQIVNDRTLGLAFRDLALAEKQAEGYPEIQERIRYLQYYLRHVWRYANLGQLTLEEAKGYYNLLCRIKNLEINSFDIWGSPVREARRKLASLGVSSEELLSLCDNTVPTIEDAKKWMREALGKLVVDKDLIDIAGQVVNKSSVQPLGVTSSLPRLPAASMRRNTVWVIAQAGDTVNVKVYTQGGGTLDWTGPDGTKVQKTVPGSYNWQDINFSAPISGTYELYGDWVGIDVINQPTAFVRTTGGMAGGSFYFYTPPSTPALVVQITSTGPVQLYDSNSQLVLNKTCPSPPCEWGLKNPVSGIWKIVFSGDINYLTGFKIMGIPQLVGNDPNKLIVSSLPLVSFSAPAEVVAADLLLPQQAAQAVVNGSGVTMKSRIYHYFSLPNTVQAEKPSFATSATSFRVDEAGTTKAVSDLGTKLSWSADPTKISSLLFDIPSPRITSEAVITDDGINYAKEITISSDISLQDVLANVKINPAYSNWRVSEKILGVWTDKTADYKLTVSGDTATFSGFGLSTKEFRITGTFEPTKWWNESWQYRKKLSFNLTGETLNDFPVLVVLNSTNFDYFKAKSDGSDLRFISQDTTTQLNYHIEKWSPAGNSYIWVKVPKILASSNNWIWLYYGNPSAARVENESGTFDSNYLAAWHLDETGNAIDSTINSNTASCTGCPPSTSGISGGARNLDGTQSFSINVAIASGQPFTMEMWINPSKDYYETLSNVAGSPTFMTGENRGTYFNYGRGGYNYNAIQFYYDAAVTVYGTRFWVSGLYQGNWYHVVAVHTGSEMRIYLNGDLGSRDSGTHYGTTLNSIGSTFNGIIDEARVSNVARSSEWLKTTYLAITNQFITFGIEKSQTALDTTPPTISNIISSYSTVSSNITWNTDDLSNSTVNYGNTIAVTSIASNTAFITSHKISIIGLLPNRTYYYKVTSCNSENLCNSSSIRNFTTNALSPTEICVDADNDNFFVTSPTCTSGNDCNDANANINPGATDICGNSIDEDCSGADLSCPEQSPGGTSSGGSSGGGGAIVSISAPIEKPITKEPEITSPQQVIESTGTVTMELSAPDTVESGDYYDATVKLLSPIKKTYTLKIADIQQEISLDAGKEKSVTIILQAPEDKGAFTLVALVEGTTRTKDISLNFLPLVLTVDKSKSGNQTLVNITVKNYQPLSTELRIIKDGRSDVFIELIEGQKEYQRQLKLTQPGEYKIIAVASSAGKMIDTDEYLLSIAGEKQFNYGLMLIVIFAFVAIAITLTFLVR